jgi:hypothetical protein
MRSSRYRDVLLAADRIADTRRLDAAAGIEAPQFLQGAAVIGDEGAPSHSPVNRRLPTVASAPAQFGRSVRATALVSPVTGSSALTLPVVGREIAGAAAGAGPPVNRSPASPYRLDPQNRSGGCFGPRYTLPRSGCRAG